MLRGSYSVSLRRRITSTGPYETRTSLTSLLMRATVRRRYLTFTILTFRPSGWPLGSWKPPGSILTSAPGGGTRDKRGTNKNGVIEKAGDGRRMGGGGVSGLTGGAGG